jgi:hypothetical protein
MCARVALITYIRFGSVERSRHCGPSNIHGLFNVAFSTSGYITSVIVIGRSANNELGRTWKEVVVA